MPRQESHIVAQRKELQGNRVDELRKITVGVFPRSNRVSKEYVANECKSLRFMKVRHMPARVPGAMKYGHRFFAKADPIAILQPAIGREGLRAHA